jgi:hypothetical protein
MQAPLQSPECSHIGDSESSSRLNTSVNPWREQLQIDPDRPHEDGKTIRPKQHVQHPDQNEDEAEEPSQRGLQQICIPRISVRRLLARILVLLAVVLPVYKSANPGAVRRHTGSVEPQSTSLWP